LPLPPTILLQRHAVACLRAAHKSGTYRSLRFRQLAALVPSVGIITLEIELRSARLQCATVSERSHAACGACSALPSH
jgi:hypothetical protein